MTTSLVHRPARLLQPRTDEPPQTLEAPPLLPEGSTSLGAQALLPLAGAGSSLTMMLVFRGSVFAAVGALVMVITVLATVAFVVSQRGQATRTRRRQRERYLDYLEELRETFAGGEREQRERARALDPPPAALTDVARNPARLWERRRADPDFLRVRVGTGSLPARRFELRDQGSAVQPTDPFMLNEARALIRRFSTVPGMPLRVALDRAGDVSIVGDRDGVLAAARAMVVQAATLHAPEDLGLALVHPPEAGRDWAWAGWLPHLNDVERRGGTGPLRRSAPDVAALSMLLADDLTERSAAASRARRGLSGAGGTNAVQRLLVIVDGYGRPASPLPLPDRAAGPADLGITVVHLLEDRLHEPEEVSARVLVHGDDGRSVTVDQLGAGSASVSTGELDDAPLGLAEGLARQLAPLRLSPDSYDDGSGSPAADLPKLLGIEDPRTVDLRRRWELRGERDFLRVPLGVDDAGAPVLLDLKEPAQLGMGPHGLCVGATGSGKSELLRTLVLSLLVTHPPDRLSMVLVDYKGGATFAPLAGLPHVAGLITNLEDDLGLVERMHASLAGEVQRRQQLLKDAGVGNITDYQLVRAERDLAPLPHLLVIIDEFAELISAEPDFIELFLSIGRIGRSIGVHLLLASQRIESGKLRGLDTYLSYRLGLRTFSDTESRTVLDTVDAFTLPAVPGFGYLKVDTSVYRRFKAGYVSGPYRGEPAQPVTAVAPRVLPLPPLASVAPALPEEDEGQTARLPERTTGPTLLSTLVERIAAAGAADSAGHRSDRGPLWLPPLPAAVSLDRVGGSVEAGPLGLRLTGAGRAQAQSRPLQVPLGLLDDPGRQWQGRWDLDLSRAGGHAAVIGAPRSGRTTLLRTLVLGLALTSTPADVGVYAVDLLGAGLSPLADLPHVGGVAARGDRERVRRTIEEVHAMLDERERVFRERHLDSVEALRAAHAAGRVPELPVADVVLVLDGYGQLAGEFEEVEPLVHAILDRGGSYGVHVVTTVGRWGEMRMAQQSAFGTRVELRLGDPGDSTIERKLVATISTDTPGRALTQAKLVAQVALPRIDSCADPDSIGEGLEQAVRAVRASLAGSAAAPRVRVLPPVLPAAQLPGPDELPAGVPLGLDEGAFRPVVLDLDGRDNSLLVLGDPGSGKTNLLRLVAAGLLARYTAEELVFAVVDPRRRLADAVPEAYLGAYAPTATLAAGLAQAVSAELATRIPEPGAAPVRGPRPLPRIVLVVDDYDVLSASGTAPLAPFAPYLSAAADLNFHVLLTRRVSGASRGLYEPFVLALRESGATALMLSGDRAEGVLLGGLRPSPLPPGRGLLIRPGERVRTVQTGLVESED